MQLRERGVTMVESLVALVVLSIGLLGIAGLFVESLRSSRTALLRTHAVNLAGDIADRILANGNARDAYDTATYAGAPAIHHCAPTAADVGINCSVAELAEDDLARWQAAVSNALPAPADPATAAVVGAIVGEFVASQRGLGYVIVTTQSSMNTSVAFAALVWISVVGLVLYGAVVLLARLWAPWAEGVD